jgi:ketosteroid isomerase-like protein
MKLITTILIILSMFSHLSCQDNSRQSEKYDPSEDEKRILSVIENESRDFYRKDHESWSTHYVQTPEVFWVCVEPDVTLRANGWQDLSQFVATWMDENPEPMDYDAAEYKLSDIEISISGDLAFVTMKSSNIQPDGSLRTLNGNRTMKRIDGEWKIVSMTSYPNDIPEGSTPNIYVHN